MGCYHRAVRRYQDRRGSAVYGAGRWRYVGFYYGGVTPTAVDLGLPSGTKWANFNVGANAPEDFGLYFSWGNTDGHEEGSGYDFSKANYDATEAAAISENLTLDHDMAHVNLGEPWSMPTKEDFQELYDNCTSVWTTLKGVAGRLFISNVNGNRIFLPAAGNYSGTTHNYRGSFGYYWSSIYYSDLAADNLLFGSQNVYPVYNYDRYYGFSVRAVLKDNAS